MQKIGLSVLAVAVMSNFGFAGGDFTAEEAGAMAAAEEVLPYYVGLGLTAASTRDSDVSLSFTDDKNGQDRTGDISVLAGYKFNPYVAVEGRYTTSFYDEDYLTRDSWGLYVKPQYPVTEEFTVYTLLGYGGLNVDSDGSSYYIENRNDVDDSGFQWGLGASYALTYNVSIFADYINIANDMDADMFMGSLLAEVDSDTVTAGVTYSF